MRRGAREAALDPFENPGAARGGVASVLAGARASLVNPSRPFTPADALRCDCHCDADALSACSACSDGGHTVEIAQFSGHSVILPCPPACDSRASLYYSGRPLFGGTDYSSTSRPSSAYSTGELRQGFEGSSGSEVYGSVEFDTVRASDEFAGAGRVPFAAVNGMRPNSSHGSRDSAPRGPPQVGSQSIEFPAETPAQPTELPLPMDDDRRGGPSGGGAATAALVAELDLPGADLHKLMDDLWHHVTSAEYRDDQAAGLPVERIVVSRLSRMTEEHNSDAKMLLAIGRVLLQAISRRGSGLQSTCRMLFKLSKTEKNDELFNAAHIIEPLISLVIREAAEIGGDAAAAAAPPTRSGKRVVTACDVLVYAIGTLKNISNQSQENQQRLGQQGVFAAMSEVLTASATDASIAVAPGSPAPSAARGNAWTDRQAQVLVQATATLRNMAVLSAHRRQFVTFEMVQRLCTILRTEGAAEHVELMLNISRILSKLTLHEECRVPMYTKPTVQALLRLLREHETNHALVLRTSFILGNLTTTQDECRNFVLETPGAVEQLLSLLGQLVDSSCSGPREPPPVVSASSDGGDVAGKGRMAQSSEVDATLVKLIRLVANLAINEELGMMISQDPSAMLLCRVIEAKPVAQHEELVLNAVSAITNLSFYQQPLNSVLNHELIATLLVPLLLHENHEAKVESARCYGNLSRYPEIRRLMKSKRVDEMLCILLDHPQQSVLTAVCGVLMNIAADDAFRRNLREMHAAQKL
eukprot:COSAG02_NODE_243_length_27457_cov_16.852328_14_plen_757_part_00